MTSAYDNYYNPPAYVGQRFREIGSYLNVGARFIDCDFTLLNLTNVPISGQYIRCLFNRTIFVAAGIVDMDLCSFID